MPTPPHRPSSYHRPDFSMKAIEIIQNNTGSEAESPRRLCCSYSVAVRGWSVKTGLSLERRQERHFEPNASKLDITMEIMMTLNRYRRNGNL